MGSGQLRILLLLTSFPGSLFSPPLVVGRKTLVAAGHVTTQNLGDKKICWIGGVAEYFVCWCDKLCGFQAVAKNHSFYRASKSNLPMKNATRFLPFLKYRGLSFTKKFGRPMEQKRFAVSKCKRSRTESK